MGRFKGPVHVGVRSYPQVHHYRDEPGIVGAAIYGEIFIDQRSERSHPNKAVDVVVCQTSCIESGSRFINFGPALHNKSRADRPLAFGLFSYLPPARLPPRRAPTSRCATARTPLHSPTAGAVTRPAFGPPLPPLSSSHSSHRAHRAASHIAVSRCLAQMAPRYTARSPPAACAPSYLRLC